MLNQIVYEALPVLTATPFQLILGSLAHMQGGTANPITTGYQKPLSTVVFFCHSKIKTVSSRLHSVMAVSLGNSKELPFLYRFLQTLSTLPPNELQIISGGLIPNTGHAAMNTSTGETTPQNPQTKIQDLLTNALQELSHIETISCLNADGDSVLYAVFQHSQRALNALHDLKNVLGIENLRA
jgi:hypothetical protein